MEAANYTLNFVFDSYLLVLLLRVWLQAARADFYNPFSQFVVKITNPVVIPFRRLIPGIAGIDMATLVVALLIACARLSRWPGRWALLTLVCGVGMFQLSHCMSH